jgi:3-hydroxyisobutyrate dehydrogenase-like beta-hydroxyacid dehydrogenase
MLEGLTREGINIAAYDKFAFVEPQGKLIKSKADQANVQLKNTLEELIDSSDFILCAVSADAAIPIAISAKPFLKEGQYYVDMNSTSPATKMNIKNVIAETKAKYVEVAIMAPIASYGCKVPIFACGNGAKEFSEVFNRFGMNVTYLSETVGKASAIKMTRSICIKGFIALMVETLAAANKYDIVPEVMESVKKTLIEENSFDETITVFLTGTVLHSARFGHEMEEVIETLKGVGMDYTMTAASLEKMKWCTKLGLKEYFKGKRPPHYSDVLKAYEVLKA